jgi:hypothetical protein
MRVSLCDTQLAGIPYDSAAVVPTSGCAPFTLFQDQPLSSSSGLAPRVVRMHVTLAELKSITGREQRLTDSSDDAAVKWLALFPLPSIVTHCNHIVRATFRAVSANSRVAELIVRFLRVTIPNGGDSILNSTASFTRPRR